ncbi:MAG TPA: hypothetical protein VH500_04320 [Nitrososphaeraceae archaeon]
MVDTFLLLMIGFIISPLLFQSFPIQFLRSLYAQSPDKITLAKILLDDALDAVKKNDAAKALIRLNLASQEVTVNETLPLKEPSLTHCNLQKYLLMTPLMQ